MPILEVDNVSKRYAMRRTQTPLLSRRGLARVLRLSKPEMFAALQDVSFTVEPGESVGIIGQNGSGKSTLLKIIAGVTLPSSGRVVVQGQVASLLELGAGFHGMLTGRENVYLNAAILGMSHDEVDAIYNDVAEFAGIGDFINNPVDTYSSGMYVRLAFAVAAHVNPDIFLVDEVLAVGDEEFQRKCRRRIAEFREQGRTILFVSHDLGIVHSLCDRVILLNKGRMETRPNPEDTIDYYLRTVGSPKGVCTLSKGPIEAVFNQGRASFFYKKHEFTAPSGLTAKVRSMQQDHEAASADWEVEARKSRCVARGRMPRLPLTHVWKMNIEGDTVVWHMGIDCERDVPLEMIEAYFMVPARYTDWIYGDLAGKFPDILPEDTGWTSVVAPDVMAREVAALPPPQSDEPPMLITVEPHKPYIRLMWANSDYVTGCRILLAGARIPGTEDKFPAGHHDLLTMRFQVGLDHDEVRRRVSAQRTLQAGPLSAVFEHGRIRLSYEGQLLTSLVHGYTSMLISDLWNDSLNLQWAPAQRSGDRLTVSGYSRRFPFRQIWELEPARGGIAWRVLLETFEPLDVQEYHASIALRHEYDSWKTDRESGAFPPFEPGYEDWRHLNRSYEPGHRASAFDSSLPSVTLEADPGTVSARMTVLNTGFSQNARVLQALRTPDVGFLHFDTGTHLYFSGLILVGSQEDSA